MLHENNVRTGFFERDQFDAVLRSLPEEVQPVVSFGYLTGWRVSEILGLAWRQVDFAARTVRLEPGTTRNGEGRMFPFTPELRALLEGQRQRIAIVQSKAGRIIPNVFHRDGEPIKSFRGAWATALEAREWPGVYFTICVAPPCATSNGPACRGGRQARHPGRIGDGHNYWHSDGLRHG